MGCVWVCGTVHGLVMGMLLVLRPVPPVLPMHTLGIRAIVVAAGPPVWLVHVCRQGCTLSLPQGHHQFKRSVLFIQSLLHHPLGHGLHLHTWRGGVVCRRGGVHSVH